MALGRIWPAYFQRVCGCCGSRALPTCFLKAPVVFPLLWTATLLVLRAGPRPSCSVVFAAAAIHDSSQVNYGVLAGGSDADGALFEGITSTTHGRGIRPQVGSLRRILKRVFDTSEEGKSASHYSVEGRDESSTDDNTHGGGGRGGESRGTSTEYLTHSSRQGRLGHGGFSVTEHPVTGDTLAAGGPAEDGESGADDRRAPEHTMDDRNPLDDFVAGEEEGMGNRYAETWAQLNEGSRAAGGREEIWNPDRSTHPHRGDPSQEEIVRSGRSTTDAAVQTEESETQRSRKKSRRTHSRARDKRVCLFARNATRTTVLLAALGVALLGGGLYAARGRRRGAGPYRQRR